MGRLLALALALLLTLMPVAAAAPDVTPSQRVRRGVVVRAGPGAAAAAVGWLAPGESLPPKEVLPRWRPVRLSDERSGFVSRGWTVVAGSDGERLVAAAADTRVYVIGVGTGLAASSRGSTSSCYTTPAARTTFPPARPTGSCPTFARRGHA